MNRTLPALALLAGLFSATGAFAQANIDQTRALNGGINTTDAPGFPITLMHGGHYRLTGNLVVPANTHGIVIEGHNITLDLNGFTISGPASCSRNASTRVVTCSKAPSGEIYGVATLAPMQGITVRNGTVRGFQRGLRLYGQSHVEGITASHNSIGIQLTSHEGSSGLVLRSRAEMNSTSGITVYGGQVMDSLSSRNGWYGFSAGSLTQTQVIDSTATGNGRLGFSGVIVRGTFASDNASADRTKVHSLGQNVDEQGVY